MKFLWQFTFIISLWSGQLNAQSNKTILYKHFYNLFQLGNKVAYSYHLFGALYIYQDTLAVYKVAPKEDDLKKTIDLSGIESNNGFMRSLNTGKWYELVNSKKENLFLEITKDSTQWQILGEKDTIMDIPCISAIKDNILVWYAPSILPSTGPFGLEGLPGLILKLHDLKYHYLVEAYSIVGTAPALTCSKRMLYMTDERYIQRQKDLHDSKAGKKVKWFWQR